MKFCWVTIHVDDMEKSLAFYQEIIGLEINRRIQPNPDMDIVFLGSGETQVELIYNKNENSSAMGEDISLGFVVDSLEKISAILKDREIPIHSGPYKPNPAIQFLYVLDPSGVKIQFVEHLQ